MNHADVPKSVAICDSQPVTAEGIRNLLSGITDLVFLGMANSLPQATDLVQKAEPDVLILDKAFGIQALLDWLAEPRSARTTFIVWGVSISEADALRLLQAGALGILHKTTGVPSVLACLRAVSQGRTWTEDTLFRDSQRAGPYRRGELTERERQVLELVEQGFKNREIGIQLGICAGTVKIHMKHIFQKTGVRGRYGLALNGMKERGMAGLARLATAVA